MGSQSLMYNSEIPKAWFWCYLLGCETRSGDKNVHVPLQKHSLWSNSNAQPLWGTPGTELQALGHSSTIPKDLCPVPTVLQTCLPAGFCVWSPEARLRPGSAIHLQPPSPQAQAHYVVAGSSFRSRAEARG